MTASDTITIEEARQRLGISRNGAYNAARRGQIPVVRIGRRLLVPRLPFERMLEGKTYSEEIESQPTWKSPLA